MPRKRNPKKEVPKSLKGMSDVFEPEYFAYQGLFEKASEIALYYGFKPIELPILEKEELFISSIGEGTDIIDKEAYSLKTKGGYHLTVRPEGTAGVMRAYIEHGMRAQPQPVMLYYYGPFFRHKNPQKGHQREFRQFGLEILGTTKSIADATVIKVALTILEEAGFKNLKVRINSLGDQDSLKIYTKELASYYKKFLNVMCTNCRERIKINPLNLLDCKDDKCRPLKEEAPDSISFLSTDAKKHFKEVLEYLDAMEVPYEIDSTLTRGLNYYSQTIFEIIDITDTMKEPSSEETSKEDPKDPTDKEECEQNEKKPTPPVLSLAGGGRYDSLSKKLGHKKEVPSVGISIEIDRVVKSDLHKKIDPRICKKPKVFFIQLGFDAKLKSLTVIETLRKAHIPIQQSLTKDRLSGQLAVAEKLNIPYTIILGQKEAIDNTVIIRDMSNRSQETINIDKLPEYIKKKLK